jgi:hypothetical protein
LRKLLATFKKDMPLFSETRLKPHMRFYGLAVKTGTKAELPEQLRRASFAHAQVYLISFRWKQQGSTYRLETLKCSLQLFRNLPKDCGMTQTSQVLEISPSWQVT